MGLLAPDIHKMKTLAWIIATLIFIVSDTVQADDDGDMETRRHHEDDVINERMERYEELLKRKRDVIDKFLKDNYSDFNHSDYTPEEYVSHPINAYMLMKRTTVIWQAAKNDILDPSSEELYKEIQEDLKNYQKQEL